MHSQMGVLFLIQSVFLSLVTHNIEIFENFENKLYCYANIDLVS